MMATKHADQQSTDLVSSARNATKHIPAKKTFWILQLMLD